MEIESSTTTGTQPWCPNKSGTKAIDDSFDELFWIIETSLRIDDDNARHALGRVRALHGSSNAKLKSSCSRCGGCRKDWCSSPSAQGDYQGQAGLQEHIANLERQLTAARAGEAEAQFGLIELQHIEFEQQSRCQQLEDALAEADLEVQRLQIDLQRLQRDCRNPDLSDDFVNERLASSLQLQCMTLRLELQASQLNSLRATRDELLEKKLAVGGSSNSLAEAQLPSLLQYVQEVEKLLDSHIPQSSDQNAEREIIKTTSQQKIMEPAAHRWKSFLDDPRPASDELKSCLTANRLKKHSATDNISMASTTVGSSSSPSCGVPEDGSPTSFLWQEVDPKTSQLSSPPTNKVKVSKHVRFRPMLRMHRDRSGSPNAESRRPGSQRRRSSSKVRTKSVAEQAARDSLWSLPDFTDWYG